MSEVNGDKRFFDRVIDVYEECSCKDGGKGDIMRWMSKSFQKTEMKNVFNALQRFGVFE
jgi:hypothetical protein